MEALVLIAAIILATGIGMGLIHLLNAQRDTRIAAHRYSDPPMRPHGKRGGTGRRSHRRDADR